MFRSAMVGTLLGAVVAAVAGGCVPGAIEPRRGGAGGATGGAIGGETIAVRDGSAEDLRAAVAGVAGSAGQSVDAGHAAGGSATTSELPAADAGRGLVGDAAAAALADAHPLGDATADAPVTRAPRLGELAIDEVLVNPTGDDLGREWIELANRSGDWLDLSGLHLANASVDVAVAAGAIAPGGLRVLGQSADPSKNGGAPVDVAYGTKLILGNADGEVSICLGACASGLMLDTVAWGTLDDDTVGHALVVDPLTNAICAAGTPFGTGGSFGTPGLPNPPCGQDAGAGGLPDAAAR